MSDYAQLKAGTIEPKVMAELNNTAGKMINTVRVQLDYSAARKEEPNIGFLNGNTQA